MIQQNNVRNDIRQQIIQSLPDSELVKISISTKSENEQEWFENGKEFRYKDQMYDVVRIVRSVNEIIYFCIQDRNEQKLRQKLNQYIISQLTDHLQGKGKGEQQLNKTVKSDFIETKTNQLSENCETDILIFLNQPKPISVFREILTPPPEFIIA